TKCLHLQQCVDHVWASNAQRLGAPPRDPERRAGILLILCRRRSAPYQFQRVHFALRPTTRPEDAKLLGDGTAERQPLLPLPQSPRPVYPLLSRRVQFRPLSTTGLCTCSRELTVRETSASVALR